ncbi:MAG: hypothetical protein LBI53_01555 [Candidatus Peribacteria bacterium]|jgi:hypothetical protein|nr:hypothetical protein [Candidatus Peribacteria bacterium]
MTKNLFFLFSLYFFVIQAVIIGYLSNDLLFYKLGAINAGAILLISILYALFTQPNTLGEKAEKKEKAIPPKTTEPAPLDPIKKEPEKSFEPKKETVGISKIVQSTTPPEKKKKKKKAGYGQRILLLITLGVCIGIYYITVEFIEYRSVLLSII